MTATIIDGKTVAKNLRLALKDRVQRWSNSAGRSPHLAVVLASDDPASAVYVRNKGRAAEEVGIRSSQYTLDAATPAPALLELIVRLGEDDDVDGILVQLPLPKQHNAHDVIFAIPPEKDVDGLHPQNAGRLARGDESGFVPCTPAGCIRLLTESGVSCEGKRATVLGRSALVGRPIADLLVNRNATVTICHSRTRDLADRILDAEILIAAIGKPEFVKGSWVRPGAAVIDVGINRKDSGALCGDVFFASAQERASVITPVPGGVGPMTIAYLLENTFRAAERRALAAK